MDFNFDEELDTIRSPSIRRFCEECIKDLPPYFYRISASASGKYHPKYAVIEHGLFYHTKAAVKILNHMLGLDIIARRFTPDECDIMRCALILHDGRKQGEEENGCTRFDHPLLEAEAVRNHSLTEGMTEPQRDIIAYIISTHMGEFTTSTHSEITLPRPVGDMGWLVHICDYLASRKDIIVENQQYYDVDIITSLRKE